MDDHNEIMEDNTVENTANNMDTQDVNSAIKADGTQQYDPAEWSKAPKKDPKTGRFIAGTGGSTKGGRPKGSKDRVSQAMVDLATELVADRGRELFHEMADRDPAQALALVSKIISPEELRAVYAEDRKEEKNQPQEVTINLVSSPSPRLSDRRTDQQIQDNQRGLTSPVQRIESPSQDDLRDVIEAAVDEPTEPVESPQEVADREAAEAERQRVARQNALIREHGGMTGKPRRGSAPNTLDYPDDPSIV